VQLVAGSAIHLGVINIMSQFLPPANEQSTELISLQGSEIPEATRILFYSRLESFGLDITIGSLVNWETPTGTGVTRKFTTKPEWGILRPTRFDKISIFGKKRIFQKFFFVSMQVNTNCL